MLLKCRSCVYFSSAMNGACLKFGKKFVDGFYMALECRMNENKCGQAARWYLEKNEPLIRNEARVQSPPPDGRGR